MSLREILRLVASIRAGPAATCGCRTGPSYPSRTVGEALAPSRSASRCSRSTACDWPGSTCISRARSGARARLPRRARSARSRTRSTGSGAMATSTRAGTLPKAWPPAAARERAGAREHRARQVLGQGRRAAQPAGGRLDLDHARRAVVRHGRRVRPPARGRRARARRPAPRRSAREGVRVPRPACASARASRARARVESANNFPTGAGLASSASGFAALVRPRRARSISTSRRASSASLARRGSGSAARSIFGGFVEMHAGRAADGADSFAQPLLAAERGRSRS